MAHPRRINQYTLSNLLLAAVAFLAFTQTSLHLWPPFAFVYGVRVDYLAPSIYLSDIAIVGLIVVQLLDRKSRSRFLSGLFVRGVTLLLALALVNCALAQEIAPCAIRWIKVFELVFLSRAVYLSSIATKTKFIIKPLLATLVLMVPIGLAQVFLKRSTDIFYIFGERTFTIDTPGIATRVFGGSEFLRAYATFSHPNSYSGFLLVLMFLAIFAYKSRGLQKWEMVAAVFLCLAGIATAMSFSTFGYLAILGAVLIWRESSKLLWVIAVGGVVVSLALPFVSRLAFLPAMPQNITLRLTQFERLTSANTKPWFGIGANNTILHQKADAFTPFTLQPIHNVYLLILYEVGLVGLMVFLGFLYTIYKRAQLDKFCATLFLAVVLAFMFDHYQVTQQQNVLLVAIVLALVAARLKSQAVIN